MTKIAIIGLGEMGASIAAVLSQNANHEVTGVDSDTKAVDFALKTGIITKKASNIEQIASQMDVIILATPVNIISQLIVQLSHLTLKKRVIITDTGSTKREIMALAEKLLTPQNITFIGGHAMAGTHKSGMYAADVNLYHNVIYFLMPSTISTSDPLIDLFRPLGANFKTMLVDEHDDLMAMISDVPHIVAFALVNAATSRLGAANKFGQYVAGGFKDTTRIAASDPELWTDALLSNSAAVLDSQKQLIVELEKFNTAILANDRSKLMAMITEAKTSRETLLDR